MSPLSPTRSGKARISAKSVVADAYSWLHQVELSEHEVILLREHIERSLQMDDGEVRHD